MCMCIYHIFFIRSPVDGYFLRPHSKGFMPVHHDSLDCFYQCPNTEQETVGPCLCWTPPNIHKQVWLSLLWGPCSFPWVLVNTRFCLYPPRVSVSTVLWKSCNQILLTVKVRFPGDSQFLCWIPKLGNLLCGIEMLQQWENFQFVDLPPGDCMVGLLMMSSRRTYYTCHASQDCCYQNPCSCGRPLLTHAYTRDPQTITGRSGLVSCVCGVTALLPRESNFEVQWDFITGLPQDWGNRYSWRAQMKSCAN